MNLFHLEVSKTIQASSKAIYAVISDYEVGHQAILPKPYFTEMIVEKGGQGAGTELTISMEVMRDKRTFHQIVEEPEPGRILIERDLDTAQITQFTLEPLENGQATEVTIMIEFELRKGLSGWIEGFMSKFFLRYLFNKELDNLAEYVASDERAYLTS